MISKRIKAVATVGLAFVVVLGAARVVLAQFGGIGGIPTVPDGSQLATIATNTLIAVETVEKDGVKVYNIEDGTWFEYRAPGGTRTRPLGFGNCVAIKPKGSKVTQLAVFSGQSNDPLKGCVTLDYVVGGSSGAAHVQHHRRLFRWSSALCLQRPGLEMGRPGTARRDQRGAQLGERVATFTHGDRLYIFNAKFGRWDDSGDRPK